MTKKERGGGEKCYLWLTFESGPAIARVIQGGAYISRQNGASLKQFLTKSSKFLLDCYAYICVKAFLVRYAPQSVNESYFIIVIFNFFKLLTKIFVWQNLRLSLLFDVGVSPEEIHHSPLIQVPFSYLNHVSRRCSLRAAVIRDTYSTW